MAAEAPSTIPSSEYDFIVVGGGTSGLVVAARLAEDPNVQVLVLEAGSNALADHRVNIPAMWAAALGSELDWGFQTTPQENLKGRTVRHPQGRALGGSSAINNQAFIAPSQSDIKAWGELGNPGWDWPTLAPYYKKFHTVQLPDEATQEHLGLSWADKDVDGATGPISVSYNGVLQDPLAKAWVDTFKKLGYGNTADPFSGKSIGGYANASTVDAVSKTRSYSASAYYAPVMEKKNLHVATGALVQKILLEKAGPGVTATGVNVVIGDKTHSVSAKKEVILAAGAFQSPKILELSGIGGASVLKSHGIDVTIDNPNVGENLQDHLMTGISFEVVDGVFTGDALMRQEPEAIQGAMTMYMEHKAGPFCVGGITSHAFMPLTDLVAKSDKHANELSSLFAKHKPAAKDAQHDHLVRRILETPDEGAGALFMFLAQVNLHAPPDAKDFVQNLQPGNFLSLGATQSHPFSRGSVHISSSSVTDAPTIDPGYLSNPLDLEILARQVQSLETLAETQPLAQYIKKGGKRNHETAYVRDLDKAKEYVKETAFSNYHPAGSCAMMPEERGGVVNEKFVVHGTSNLRVVDSSVIPIIPRGNIQSTVYAVAERAADLIKSDYDLK